MPDPSVPGVTELCTALRQPAITTLQQAHDQVMSVRQESHSQQYKEKHLVTLEFSWTT